MQVFHRVLTEAGKKKHVEDSFSLYPKHYGKLVSFKSAISQALKAVLVHKANFKQSLL